MLLLLSPELAPYEHRLPGCCAKTAQLEKLSLEMELWRGHDAEGVWNADCIRSETREVGVRVCVRWLDSDSAVSASTLSFVITVFPNGPPQKNLSEGL